MQGYVQDRSILSEEIIKDSKTRKVVRRVVEETWVYTPSITHEHDNEYRACAGSQVLHVMEELVEIANERNMMVFAKFNGRKLVAKPGDNARVIVEDWPIL